MKIVNFKISPRGQLSELLLKNGITDFHEAIACVKQMPYGILSEKQELADLLTEKKGNCSAKHAFLTELAKEQGYENKVFLVLGFYKMNAENTPEVKKYIEKSGLDYLPEAHCYLFSEGKRYDFTGGGMSFEKIADTLMYERAFPHDKAVKWKDLYHQDFVKQWLKNAELGADWDFDKIWALREECLSAFERA
ncbi:hypothetical protein [Sediminitomix flava]|uniref:Transglutaminase superfamily protein n=1 Tax=Sediminitomix flava TaxID=379075 RepID=A0A315YWJ8_SEDFL|nr:hypothetical protein [Sediminitomix flava]PWJ34140.1 hypothetical protein BC781_11150 [Sediminitomix flava]